MKLRLVKTEHSSKLADMTAAYKAYNDAFERKLKADKAKTQTCVERLAKQIALQSYLNDAREKQAL